MVIERRDENILRAIERITSFCLFFGMRNKKRYQRSTWDIRV